MTPRDSQLRDWIKSHNITEVEVLVPDMTGNARGKIVPAHRFFDGSVLRLPEAIFAQTVTGEWPSDDVYEELIAPEDKDLYLRPDVSTMRVVPWVKEPTAQIIHDCVGQDGEPHHLAPRNVLRAVLQRYADEGLQPVIAPELEFFLVQKNTNPDVPLEPPVGRSGRRERARQSYSIDAVNEFDPLFEEMYDFAEAMNLDVETLIHEQGAAQMEVNFDHAEPLSRADQIFLFKRMMREVAIRHDICVTFLAKPMENEPGSSMHLHQSMLDGKSGANVFAGSDGEPMSQTMRHYIGGLQKYAPAAMIFFAPNINSYRRLAHPEASPLNVHWGFDNRTAGLRVPISKPENTRVESRFAGADANPYLAIAATLACGLLGIQEKLEPTPEVSGSAYEQPQTLPSSLSGALTLLEDEPRLREVLDARFVKAYIGIKRKEYETFFRVISSWEREHLLMKV